MTSTQKLENKPIKKRNLN